MYLPGEIQEDELKEARKKIGLPCLHLDCLEDHKFCYSCGKQNPTFKDVHTSRLARQTHLFCRYCQTVAESYDHVYCTSCSIPFCLPFCTITTQNIIRKFQNHIRNRKRRYISLCLSKIGIPNELYSSVYRYLL